MSDQRGCGDEHAGAARASHGRFAAALMGDEGEPPGRAMIEGRRAGPASLQPLDAAEFASLMQDFAPFAADRRIAVAVSGGADSLCLAWLAVRWGMPLALIVDHGLRQGSAAEAALTRARLAGFGVPARILRLTGLAAGPGLAARARCARYAALTTACRSEGLTDLLLGHHARDQAETLLLRRGRGSGPAGLAGMAAVRETEWLRLLRPLLSVPPGRLRATLRMAEVAWVEDPSNDDARAARTAARRHLADPNGTGAETQRLGAAARRHGEARRGAAHRIAAALAAQAVIRPEGFVVLPRQPWPADAFAALLRIVAGAPYPLARAGVETLAADPRPATLGGVRLLGAGRLGRRGQDDLLLVREAAAMQPPVNATPDAIWDGRFRLLARGTLPPETRIGAVGADAPRLRSATDLPAAILETLPALRIAGGLVAVPLIGYDRGYFDGRVSVVFSPPEPASGAPFAPGGDAVGAAAHHVPGQARPAAAAPAFESPDDLLRRGREWDWAI